jgi:hypothetical protein
MLMEQAHRIRIYGRDVFRQHTGCDAPMLQQLILYSNWAVLPALTGLTIYDCWILFVLDEENFGKEAGKQAGGHSKWQVVVTLNFREIAQGDSLAVVGWLIKQ